MWLVVRRTEVPLTWFQLYDLHSSQLPGFNVPSLKGTTRVGQSPCLVTNCYNPSFTGSMLGVSLLLGRLGAEARIWCWISKTNRRTASPDSKPGRTLVALWAWTSTDPIKVTWVPCSSEKGSEKESADAKTSHFQTRLSLWMTQIPQTGLISLI